MAEASITTLILGCVNHNGAAHIRERYIEIERHRPGTPEHTIRARLAMHAASLVQCYVFRCQGELL